MAKVFHPLSQITMALQRIFLQAMVVQGKILHFMILSLCLPMDSSRITLISACCAVIIARRGSPRCFYCFYDIT